MTSKEVDEDLNMEEESKSLDEQNQKSYGDQKPSKNERAVKELAHKPITVNLETLEVIDNKNQLDKSGKQAEPPKKEQTLNTSHIKDSTLSSVNLASQPGFKADYIGGEQWEQAALTFLYKLDEAGEAGLAVCRQQLKIDEAKLQASEAVLEEQQPGVIEQIIEDMRLEERRIISEKSFEDSQNTYKIDPKRALQVLQYAINQGQNGLYKPTVTELASKLLRLYVEDKVYAEFGYEPYIWLSAAQTFKETDNEVKDSVEKFESMQLQFTSNKPTSTIKSNQNTAKTLLQKPN